MDRVLIARNSEATVYLDTDDAGVRTIVKESANRFLLESEARMLEHLRPYVRVPAVLALGKRQLHMEYIPNDAGCRGPCECEVAEVLAALHAQSAPSFGFECDTTIGPFRQSNARHDRWIDFYREERVMDFTRKALDEGQLPASFAIRIERFCSDFDRYLLEPERPSLLHGDVWSGNVLCRGGRFAALIDPAIYYGHYETELAFIEMFDTFGPPFFQRYDTLAGIKEGFHESRAHIYRIFPYLVHIRAFGAGYLGGLDNILRRFGY